MKRKFKKIVAAGLVLVLAMLMTAGCKKKATPENLFDDVGKNMKDVESFGANIKASVAMADAATAISADIDLNMETVLKQQASHVDGSINMNVSGADIGMKIELYQLKDKKESISYVKLMDQWTKTTDEEDKEIADLEAINDLGDMAEAFTLEKELSEVEGEKCFRLTAELKGEELESILNEDLLDAVGAGELIDMDKLKESKIPCTIDIYKENILPARVHIDMAGVMGKLLEDSAEVPDSIEYYVEMIYKDYGKIKDIKVPKEVEEAAVETDGELDDRLKDFEEKDRDTPKVTTAEPSSELGEEWSSYTVQINNKVVALPCEIADLEAAGLKLDTEYTPKDYVVNANEYEIAYFIDNKGNEIMVDMVNSDDKAKSVAECVVGSISVNDYDLDEGGLDIVFPGGIQMGSTREEVIAAYGETDDVYEGDSMHMYTWYNKESYLKYCEIDFDSETGKVSAMSMNAHEL